MAQNAVRIHEVEDKTRAELDQRDLDELTEIVSRLKLVAKLLNQSDGLDDVEAGTLARMIGNEADGVLPIIEALESRLGE